MVGRVLTRLLYLAGLVIFFIGAGPLVRRFGRANPKILLYHECAEVESDYLAGLNCTTSPTRFRKHLQYIRQHYTIVDLDTILAGGSPKRSVAITFDDGYASVYWNAFPLLKKESATATIYLISSVIDNHSLVWVNELNFLVRRGGSDALACVQRYFDVSGLEAPADIISACRLNFCPSKMKAMLEDLRDQLQFPLQEHAESARLYLSWDQIEEMRLSGIHFGNHTRTHPNMERLTETEQIAEIEEAQKDLEKHLPQVKAFAHPFGHRASTTAALAARVGLCSAVDVGGYNLPVVPLSLGRTHLSNESVAGLFARMEVVEPVKGILRRTLLRTKTAAPTHRVST